MEELSGSSFKEDLLKYEPSQDVLCRETLSKEHSPEDLFPDEALPEDLSFEDSFTTETISQDLSSENSSTAGDKPSNSSIGDKPSKDMSSEEDLESKKNAELPDIRRDIVKFLRAVMQWCDDNANTSNNIITNFKAQLPFIIVLGVIILLLWVLKFIYG